MILPFEPNHEETARSLCCSMPEMRYKASLTERGGIPGS
jgi:hypothetical protein